ncbi:antitoxin Xre/MbcA/ParS toxin-binding domain-containing protein [Mesorhizobium sp. INR15]|uniref:antitoxin Xre/MbcA/ParS-like domain-containing protein n=1 Tax=Mesorhizobium sp. INR15 TaxID=2654248 RepID=UPI00189644A9|nr:antitoxin Xre/MbcA/ParS toxin-binding domain-containing protein [Mesorhizobium sp. INR15]QPC94742.1 DUF2384 domain-containing protein [Mesorhizobium sp. INR15]
MVTRRGFSRRGNEFKLARREELEHAVSAAVEALLKKHDPTIRKRAAQAASKLAGLLASKIAVQTQAVQRAFQTIEGEMDRYGDDFIAHLISEATAGTNKRIKGFRASPPPGPDAGALQLVDDWAGPVAGPTVIEQHYGIPRSTLYRWQKRNEAVALNTRTSKPVFPLKQFVDARPAEGISSLISLFGDQRTAWKWLVEPSAGFGGRPPLTVLLDGNVELVINSARSAKTKM